MQAYKFYTANEIQPSGWLKRQLEIQARGLCGNLDRIWPDIADSAWIGGAHEGWERVPYWLDGFIPLAYLLDDADLKRRAKKYVDAIIAAQQPDGWICPCSEEMRPKYDTWAIQLITKVLVVYYDCTRDARIPDVLYRVLKNYYELLKSGEIRLFDWGKFRWFESFVAIRFVYERYREDWLPELAKLLRAQGADYRSFTGFWKVPLNRWRFDTHIVNIAMALKAETLTADLLGEAYADQASELYEILETYNGTPVGIFTGDECLSGLSPIQGTELCSVAELMYSYEWLYAYTGDGKWAELLELAAFNALPATISEDMWTHQYVQQSNQIACEIFPGKSVFRTNGKEAHIFGLEPNFGCCTANFNQGWPKFALSTFLHNEHTVISAVPVPSELHTDRFRIRLETEYPFRNRLKYTIHSDTTFEFRVRIPSFAKQVTVNGKPGSADDAVFAVEPCRNKVIGISFETTPVLKPRPYGLQTVSCGSLVFSLPIRYERRMREYTRDGVERKFPYCDYELIPKSAWNYAFADDEFRVEHHQIGDSPFSEQEPAVTLTAKVCQIDWGLSDGYETVCAKVPESTEPISDVETVQLYPYGCAKLRMTEIPLVR